MEKENLVNADKKIAGTPPDDIDHKPNPDTELHLDQEDDSLYTDGLDVDTDAGGLAGTRGTTPGIAKP